MYATDETSRIKSRPVVWEQRSEFCGHSVTITDPETNDRIEGRGGDGQLTFFPQGKGEGIVYDTRDLLPDMDTGCWLYPHLATALMRACQWENRTR